MGSRPGGHGAWTAEDDARLRALWDAGHTLLQIGVRMGRSKNSVVGRAHRLRLTPRPSPIVPKGAARAPRSTGRFVRGNSAAALERARQITETARAATPGVYARQAGWEGISQGPPAGHPIPAQAGDPTAAVSAARGCEAVGLDVSSRTSPAALASPSAPRVSFARSERGCRWPLWGDKERPDHRYCAAPVRLKPGGEPCVYCAEHAARAYTRHQEPTPGHQVTRSTFAWGGRAA